MLGGLEYDPHESDRAYTKKWDQVKFNQYIVVAFVLHIFCIAGLSALYFMNGMQTVGSIDPTVEYIQYFILCYSGIVFLYTVIGGGMFLYNKQKEEMRVKFIYIYTLFCIPILIADFVIAGYMIKSGNKAPILICQILAMVLTFVVVLIVYLVRTLKTK